MSKQSEFTTIAPPIIDIELDLVDIPEHKSNRLNIRSEYEANLSLDAARVMNEADRLYCAVREEYDPVEKEKPSGVIAGIVKFLLGKPQ